MLIDAHIAFYSPRQNLNANHRANDWVILEGVDHCLSARFMYGPLDMVSLSNEKVRDLSFSPYVNGSLGTCVGYLVWFVDIDLLQVDIYVMTQPPSGEYVLFDTVVTGSGGRLSCTIAEEKRLPVGIYPVKLVVRYVRVKCCTSSKNQQN